MKTTTLLFALLFSLPLLANTDRYRLMFNSDPSTEITIGWEQVSGNSPEVYYGTTDFGTNWASYPSSQTPYRQVNYMGMDNRFAKITGLQPNTIYYFVIKDSQGTSQRYWFRTCPNVNTETLSFISGGDSRSGYTQRQNSNRMVAKIRPHAVLFGGDIVNTPGNGSIQDWMDHWQLTITSDNQMIPLVHSFGNHEEYGSGGANLMYDLFDTPYDVYYNVKFGGNLFSMYTLNGEVLPGHTIANNTVRTAQRNWLQSELSSDNSIWKAAQYHRPIVPHYSSKGEGADEFDDWAWAFYDYGVRLVMESDAHVVKMTEEVKPAMATASGNSSNWFTTTGIDPNKGLTFVGEGTWGTIRTPDDSHPMTTAMASFYGFNWILVNSCRIEIRTIDTQNPGAVPEHAAGDYTSISTGLENQVWKPSALPTGVRTIDRCYPPIVDFVADQTNVFTGTTVNFTDLTQNTPTTWSWNFGDGGTSTQQNPSYTYNTPGTYTVTLTCTNADGSDTETKTAYIVVVAPSAPTADFVASTTTASVGQNINFTDLSTGVPNAWSWNFGDAGTSTQQNPTHSYAAPGTYTVELTASNAYGSDTETKTAYITIVSGGTISVPIISGNDDAEEFRNAGNLGEMYLTSSDLEIGNDGGDEQYVGLRFQSINVPQGATISNAKIRFRADESDGSGSQLNIYIAAQDVNNAGAFNTNDFNISGRTLTTAQYTWADGTVPAWSAGTVYDTPDISTLVQEVVDRPGWSSGNNMVFVLWSDMGESSERVADSYEGNYPAELIFDYTVPAGPAPVANFSAPLTTVCEGGSVSLTDNSTNTPTSWSWTITGPQTMNSSSQNPSFTFNTPGTYNVQLVASNAGGSDTYTQNNFITVNAAPSVNASGATAICDGLSTNISATGANSYTWNNGGGSGATVSVSPSSTTTYTVTGTDGNGCTNTDQVTVTVNALPTVNASGATAICDGASTNISASGANSYAWNNGGGSGATVSVSPSSTTTYTVTGTDGNGCTNTDQVTVTVNALPTVNASGATAICDGASTNISATGANSYAWNNGGGSGATVSVSPSSTTTYTVTGTDGNGCTNTDQVTVTVNILPTVNASGATAICDGASTNISASGANSYAWNNGAGSGATVSVSPSSTMTYTVTGTDGNGCTNTDQVTVTVNALPTVNASGATAICEGSATTISASGANSYSWNNGIGNGDTHSVSPASTTTYTVTGTDGNGCTNTDQVTVTVNVLPTVNASGATAICDGASTNISATGANSYAWNNGGGSGATVSVSPSSTTTYTVTGTDGNGCTNTDQVMVTVNALPTVNASGATSICNGSSTNISATGANSYAWNNGAGSGATVSVSPSSTTTYTVTGTDANGCVNTDQVTITVVPTPSISAGSFSNPSSCGTSTGSIVISGSGTGIVSWTGTATGNANSVSLPYTITGLAAGSYNVSFVDGTGCASNTITQALTDPSAPAAPTISNSGPLTFCDGQSVTLTSSYGSGNTWSTSATSNSIVVTTSGNYAVQYTDGNGCSAVSNTITVTVNSNPAVTVIGATTICEGQTAVINASGASTYAWNNGAGNGGSVTVSPTTTTTYTVTGTASNGCTDTDQVTVTVNANPTVSATGTTTICEGQTATLGASGANTYAWNNGAGNGANPTVSPTTTTTYTVTGTDGNGCTNTDQVTVTVNAAPTVSASGAATICEGQTVNLSASGANTYAWDNGAGNGANPVVSPTTTTTYTVTGTASNGCTDTDQVTVTVNPLPAIASGIVTDPSSCGSATGSVQVTGSGNGDISWTGTSSGNVNGVSMPYTITGLTAGTYNITYTDANGCTSNILAAGLTDPNAPAAPSITPSGATTFCDGGSVTLSSSYATGNDWTTSESTQDIVVTTSGSYSVTYTDANGCSSVSTPTIVTVNVLPQAPTISANGALTFCEGESVTLTASQPTGIVWSTSETTQSIDVTTAGIYDVTYTDGNGCSSTSTQTTVVVNPLPTVGFGEFGPTCLQDAPITLSQGTPAGGTYLGPGVTNGVFNPAAAGEGTHTITYTYVDGNGCENSTTQTVVVQNCAGLEELSAAGYTVYPNPADDVIFIERSNGAEKANVKIFDAAGRLVLETETKDNPMSVNVENWSKGTYTIQLTVGNKDYISKVIIR